MCLALSLLLAYANVFTFLTAPYAIFPLLA